MGVTNYFPFPAPPPPPHSFFLVSAGIIFSSVCVASGCLSLESYDSFAVGLLLWLRFG
jgi:hypothetical protein